MFDMSTTSTSTCHALSRKHQHGNRVSSIIQLYHMRSVYATTPVRQAGTAQLSTKYLHIAREALVSPKREEGWNYARTFQQQTWVRAKQGAKCLCRCAHILERQGSDQSAVVEIISWEWDEWSWLDMQRTKAAPHRISHAAGHAGLASRRQCTVRECRGFWTGLYPQVLREILKCFPYPVITLSASQLSTLVRDNDTLTSL